MQCSCNIKYYLKIKIDLIFYHSKLKWSTVVGFQLIPLEKVVEQKLLTKLMDTTSHPRHNTLDILWSSLSNRPLVQSVCRENIAVSQANTVCLLPGSINQKRLGGGSEGSCMKHLHGQVQQCISCRVDSSINRICSAVLTGLFTLSPLLHPLCWDLHGVCCHEVNCKVIVLVLQNPFSLFSWCKYCQVLLVCSSQIFYQMWKEQKK